MSVGSQVTAFCRDVARERTVWTIAFEDGDYLKWVNADETEVFPVWSTKTRVERVLKLGEEFSGGRPVSFSLESFIHEWLPRLVETGTKLGPNWAGENLSGWSFEPEELIQRVCNQSP